MLRIAAGANSEDLARLVENTFREFAWNCTRCDIAAVEKGLSARARERKVTVYLPITKRRNTCQSPIATFHPSGAAQLPRSRYHYGCASR